MHCIDANPVRAGITAHTRDHAWSSYSHYATGDEGANSAWLIPHLLYDVFRSDKNAKQAAYWQLLRQMMPDVDLNAIRDATNKGWALGDDRFREEIERTGERRASSKGKGRLKKML